MIRVTGRMAPRALAITGVLAVLAGAVWLLVWKVPPALAGPVPPEPAQGARDAEIAASATRYAAYRADITNSRTGIIAGLAGLAALGGLVFTGRTYRLSLRTYGLSLEGQLTDRYTTAVAQLGHDKLNIRLGGIYALGRLAVDSPRDHPTVVEVLSAYIRERTRARAAPRTRPPGRRTAHPLRLGIPPEPLAVDIQAALTVLGRLPQRIGVSRGDLSGANLTGANLDKTDLTQANLDETNLTNASLIDTNLTKAGLSEATLTEAHLESANLTEANLYRANLTEAHLDGANLTGANLYRANLTEADLDGANLTAANLYRVNLTAANLYRANLIEAHLDGANLTGANLHRANLSEVSGSVQRQLGSAHGDESTLLSMGLARPASWPAPSSPDPATPPSDRDDPGDPGECHGTG